MSSGKSAIHPFRYTDTDGFGGGPRNWRNCGQSCCFSVTFRPSFFQLAWMAVAISLCPGALLKMTVTSLTGDETLSMYFWAWSMFAVPSLLSSVLWLLI